MDAIKELNGTVWVFALLLVGMVVVQSLLFLRLALNFNKKNKVLTNDEVKQAVRTGAVSAVGPAFSTLTVAISLIAMVGSGVTFMRCGVIGAPAWELMMAGICTSTLGIEFGSPEFTTGVFVLCIFGMTLASAPYFLNTILTLKPLDKAAATQKKKEGRSFLPYMSNGAMMALLGYMSVDYFKSIPGCISVLTAGVMTVIIDKIAKKTGNNTLASFGMAIAMICAMVVGQILTMVMS